MSSVFIREEYIKVISDVLAEFQVKVSNRNALHFYDVDIASEEFICGLLNLIYGYSLANLNTAIQQNYPGIDLGSSEDRIAVQVTADSGHDKIQRTINTFYERDYISEYDRLLIVVIGNKQNSRKEFDVYKAP